jgi:hypothetical protein
MGGNVFYQYVQGENSVAIGNQAGNLNQANSTILFEDFIISNHSFYMI